MGAIPFRLIQGFTLGHNFIQSKRSEDEVKRGQNDYFGAFYQAFQVMDVMNVCNIALEKASRRYRIPLQLLCNAIYCLAVPAQFFCVINKEGHYESFATFWNTHVVKLRLPQKLRTHRILAELHLPQIPSKLSLSHRTLQVINLWVRHSGSIATISMVVGNLFFIYQGQTFLAAGTLFALVFDIAHRRLLWIPHRVILIFENQMPLISTIMGIFQGIWVGRAKSLLQALTFKKSIYFEIQHRCDDFLRVRRDEALKKEADFRPMRPTLREIDASWERPEILNYEETLSILDAKDEEFELNFAASSKSVGATFLPEDRDFDKLLALFITIDWSREKKTCSLVSAKLKDDDRFLNNHLKPELAQIDPSFSDNSLIDLGRNFHSYVERVTLHKNIPKEKYFADWIRDQMKYLVGVLKGEKTFEGLEADRQIVISEIAKVNAYLQNINTCLQEQSIGQKAKEELQRTKEDLLLKLAVECGGYCGLQLVRAPREMLDQIDETSSPPKNDLDAYEQKILRALERRRRRIAENDWGAIAEQIREMLNQSSSKTKDFILIIAILVLNDLHTFVNFKFPMVTGFYPMAESDRLQFTLIQFLFWRINHATVWGLAQKYQIELDTITEETGGEVAFGIYLNNKIQSLNYSEDQRQELLSMYLNSDNYKAAKHKFKKILFYRLGILKRRPTLS